MRPPMQTKTAIERWVTKRNGAGLAIFGAIALPVGVCGWLLPALVMIPATIATAGKPSQEAQAALGGLWTVTSLLSVASTFCVAIAPMLAMAGVGIYLAAHSEETKRPRSG